MTDIYKNIIKDAEQRDHLEKLLAVAYERLLCAHDAFQLEKANSILEYLTWRYERLREPE